MGVLTTYRERAGLTQSALAKLVGTSQPQIQRLEAGTRGLSKEWATKIAPHVDASPEDLMFGGRTVPLVGFVAAGSLAHFFGESDGLIGVAKMPPGGTERTVAVRVRGDSLGMPFDGWFVYYDDRRDPPTSDMIGELCVIGLASGQVMVKKMMTGRLPGHYDLWSANGAPLTDVHVEWAARVTAMLPPSVAIAEEEQTPEPIPSSKTALRKKLPRAKK